MTISKTRPADGERRAAQGYGAQYRVAAELIYDALLSGDLEWIRVADPDAGRVDDIQIARPGGLDAYQVKWTEYVGNITFHKVVTDKIESGKSVPNLVRQLADGWTVLKAIHLDRRVRVHLVTNEIPSTSDDLPVDQVPPLHTHFQAFLRDCWQLRSQWAVVDPPGLGTIGWVKSLEKLREASGLDECNFRRFVTDCEFNFSYRIHKTLPVDSRRIADIATIASTLWNLVGQYRQIVQLERQELLRYLGWEKRFEFRFKHEFYVDEALYQPVTATIEELETCLRQYNRGYIALLGSPGSGKSTTLTQTFRYRQGFRVIRYYAYVRDDTFRGRGEAQNFLHDLVHSLRQAGFHGNKFSIAESRDELLETFGVQLAKLHQDWQVNGTRTLILVDGLDHIDREQNPERSLVEDLPLPDQIPDGVLFVLGSQKLELMGLSVRIKAHLEDSGRTLTMRALNRQSVHAIVDAAKLPLLIPIEQKDTILRLSDGHPLALSYLLKKLRIADSEEDIISTLTSSNPYSGHIEEDYKVYWQTLKDDGQVRELLSLFCRLRGALDLKMALAWVGGAAIERFIAHAHHYFHKETPSRWFFFHNSFRQFLLGVTSRNILGEIESSKHKLFHRQLAEFASSSEPDNPWSWEELYHRATAGDSAGVLSLFTQEYFRRQYFSLRPLENIKEDITLCLEAARQSGDILAVIRAFLIEKELGVRDRVLEDVDFINLLLRLLGADVATDAVIRGRELLVNDTAALKFCKKLMQAGERDAAKRIFEAAEPLSILSSAEKIETIHGKHDVVKAWVSVAFHFRPINEILSSIGHVHVSSDQLHGVTLEEASESFRERLITKLTDCIYYDGSEEQLLDLQACLKLFDRGETYLERIDLHLSIDSSKGLIPAKTGLLAFNRLRNSWIVESLHKSDKLLLAELIYRLENDIAAAATILEGISQPALQDWNSISSSKRNLGYFTDRIRLNRLLSALGRPIDPIIAVPHPDNDRGQGTALFERMIVIAANVWGQAWRGGIMSPSELIRALTPCIHLFHRSWQDTKNWHDWHYISSMASEYFEFLLNVSNTHGNETRDALISYIEGLWNDEKLRRYWPKDRRRRIVLEHFHLSNDKDALIRRLNEINTDLDFWDSAYDHVSEYEQQIDSWVIAGELERAKPILQKMMLSSFGIDSEKDHQFGYWLNWLDKVNMADPLGADKRLQPFIGAQAVLHAAHRSDDAGKLLECSALISPNHALSVRNWLLGNDGSDFVESIEGVLRGILRRTGRLNSAVVIVVTHFIAPFQRSFSNELAELVRDSIECLDIEYAKKLLAPLVDSLQSKAYPSIRDQWLEILKPRLEQIGTIAEIAPVKEESENPKRGFHLRSGDILSENEICRTVTTYISFMNLLEEVVKTDYVNWEPIFAPFIGTMTLEQTICLNKKLSNFERSYKYQAVVGRRLYELGAVAEAQKIFNEVISDSSPSGWSKSYDGGTRLQAFSYLIKIDTETGRNRAFDLLVQDYLSESRYPQEFVNSLDDIIPLLYAEPPLKNIWSEFSEHIGQLNEMRLANKQPIPEEYISGKDSDAAVIELVFEELKSPIFAVRCESRRALCKLILVGQFDEILLSLISAGLNGNEEQQSEVLAVLETVVKNRPSFVVNFTSEISQLFQSPSAIIMHMAFSIADIAGLEIEYAEMPEEKLSPIYSMELPPFRMADKSLYYDNPPPGHIYPDTTDPLEMIRPYQPAFKKLSKASGVPLENLVTRASMLMRSLAPESSWNKDAEKKIMDWLDDVSFKLPYNRLRVGIAHRALSHVVRELLGASVIDDHDIDIVLEWLVIHDAGLSMLAPVPRPSWISKPEKEEMGEYPRKDWADCSRESLPLLLDRLDDGRLVLAEWSRFVKQDWGQPEEVRCSMLAPSSWPEPEVNDSFFLGKASWRANHYPNLYDLRNPNEFPFPAFRAWGWFTDGDWFAMNPSLGFFMDWYPDQNGLFRWIDKSGEVMVESLWWQDGCLHYGEPYGYCELCSEGWVVLASEKAAKQMCARIPWLTRIGKISRQKKREEMTDKNITVVKKPVWI